MGIHQAVIGGYPTSTATVNTWSLGFTQAKDNLSNKDSTFTITGLSAGDIIIHTEMADFGLTYSAPSGFTFAYNQTDNDPDWGFSYRIATSSSNISTGFSSDSDAGCVAVFSPSNPSGSAAVKNRHLVQSDNDARPTHDNQSLAFDAGELSVLIAALDDVVVSLTAPSNSTLAVADSDDDASIAIAFSNNSSSSNRSWGQWGPSTAVDEFETYVVELEPQTRFLDTE